MTKQVYPYLFFYHDRYELFDFYTYLSEVSKNNVDEYDNIARILHEKGEIKVMYDDCNHPGQSPYPYGNLEQLRYILSRAYVLYQVYVMRYPLDKALKMGTLFPELLKPWPPYYYEETVRD